MIWKCKINLFSIDTQFSTFCKSEWKGKSAGGCRNTPDWVYNPQFYLSVEQPSVVQFLLSQSAHQEFDAMGMYIFKAPEGPPQRCVPKELLTKSAFGSDQESSLIFEAQTNCIVIPCTFNPGKESPFLLSAYFNSPGVKLFEITENNEVFIDGEWSEQTAGGNTSSSTWRNNPQYRVYLDSPVDINLRLVQQTQEDFHPIGLFVFLDSGKRRLLVRPADVIATCNFTSLPAIDLKITKEQIQKLSKDKEEKFALTVMPCTYFPNLFGKFRLSVFSSGSTEVSEYQSVFRHIQHGAWTKESAGGCLNSGRTWRNNPQFQIVAKKKAKLLVLLHLPTQEEKKSIGFYILRGGSENQKILHLEDDSIVKKASFRKSHEAFCSLSVEKGERYNILPCTFLPGIQSEFSLIVFANEPDLIEFHPVEELAPTLCVSGCWEGVNAGGCMNNRSWCLNPRVALRVSNQPIRATIVLFQTSDAIKSGNLASLKAIGFNITRADESGDQIVQKPIDILASVPFEPAEDGKKTTIILSH